MKNILKKKSFRMNNASIQLKLMLVITFLMVSTISVVGGINYYKTSKIVEKSIQDQSFQLIRTFEDWLKNFTEGTEQTLDMIGHNPDLNGDLTEEKLIAMTGFFDTIRENTSNVQAVYLATEDKKMVISSENELPSDYDPTSQIWYTQAVEKNELTWTEPYIDETTGELTMSIAAPLTIDNELIGVYGINISLDELGSYVSEISLGETGYFFIVDSKNIVLAHNNNEYIGKELDVQELKDSLVENTQGDTTYALDGVKKYAVFSTMESNGWKIIGTMDYSESKADSYDALYTTIVSGVIFFVLALVVVFIIVKRIVSNLDVIKNDMEKIGEGDLSITSYVKSNDQSGKLANELNRMIDNLNLSMTNINASSEQVAAGSGQVADSAQALAQGATEQASSIEEITSSITQVSKQTSQNTLNANEASHLADIAKNDAISGNEQMNDMVSAMNVINESSINISKVIKVIEEIAFQTNILALNAAVEAARAGQQGKGFAVVAEEVRSLAARSANAAKETELMINDSIQKVNLGSKLANKSSESLIKIVQDVTKVATLIKDISEASNEQKSGIEKINLALNQITSVIQSNSATAEESAAASEELSAQAEMLKREVSKFKLKDSEELIFFKNI
ncbi:methyl-accepting chemotaxis protein [Clostridium grantii]|uniref:Methyl-accepting chemotaxis sensory transducer with Cache sensor n=1 Tax=Clostridium grantii DSM 8605 TaxID=1121316 RepID=A0A1M5TPZ3_9CLOT|nr:methyl-accepting chemotaxis protein [Clostridium grantii]SHH52837.1 methyl-accepting chemotaxis sensory transducer with Cache sensor [Clostridium grantii DSM 8605]